MNRKKTAAAFVLAAFIAEAPLTGSVHAVHAEDDPAWEKKNENDTYKDPDNTDAEEKETKNIGEISKGASSKLNAKKTSGKASNADDGPKGAGKHVSTSGGSPTWSSDSSASISDGSLTGKTRKASDQSQSNSKKNEKNASASGKQAAWENMQKSASASGKQTAGKSVLPSSGSGSLAEGGSRPAKQNTGKATEKSTSRQEAGTEQASSVIKRLVANDQSLTDADRLRLILPFPRQAWKEITEPAPTAGTLKQGLADEAYTENALKQMSAIKENRVSSLNSLSDDEETSEKAAEKKKEKMAAFVKASRRILLVAVVLTIIAVSAAATYAFQMCHQRKKR